MQWLAVQSAVCVKLPRSQSPTQEYINAHMEQCPEEHHCLQHVQQARAKLPIETIVHLLAAGDEVVIAMHVRDHPTHI